MRIVYAEKIRHNFKGSLLASVTVRKFGVITKYTEICIAEKSLNFDFKPHLEGNTHQFTVDRSGNNSSVCQHFARELDNEGVRYGYLRWEPDRRITTHEHRC